MKKGSRQGDADLLLSLNISFVKFDSWIRKCTLWNLANLLLHGKSIVSVAKGRFVISGRGTVEEGVVYFPLDSLNSVKSIKHYWRCQRQFLWPCLVSWCLSLVQSGLRNSTVAYSRPAIRWYLQCQKDPLHKCTIFLQQLFSWCRWLGFYLTKSSVWYQINVHKWPQLWSLRVSPLPLCELLGVWPQSWSWMVWPLTATLHIINLRCPFWRLSSELVLSWNWTTFHHCFVLFICFARFLSIHVIFLHLISWSLL